MRSERFKDILRIAVTALLLFSLLFALLYQPAKADEENPTDPSVDPGEEILLQGNGGDYTKNVTVANRLDVVFEEFPVGSYFSYTGVACTCHNKCSYYGGCDCISDYNDPEKNGKLVRLYSIQCMGFAHYTFYKLFGFIDSISYPENADKYHSLGSIKAANMTVSNVKKLLKDAPTGTDVRILNKHSLVILTTNDAGLYILQANWVSPCMVNIKYWTWEEFASRYSYYGIEYANVPNNYPVSKGTYVPPVRTSTPGKEYFLGSYEVTASKSGLRLRRGPGITYSQIALLPDKTQVVVTEVKDGWGKIDYNGKEGWIFLNYTDFLTPAPTDVQITLPKDRTGIYLNTTPDLSGMVVKATYADGTTDTVSSKDYRVYYPTQLGAGKLTVSVLGKTATADITCYKTGDLNLDDTVNAQDLRILMQIVAKTIKPTAFQKEGADLNGDGSVTKADRIALAEYLAGNLERIPTK